MHEPQEFKPHRVYTRQLWSDPWFLRSYLRAPHFAFACGTDMSDATLEYRYGRIFRHDQLDYAVYQPLDLSDRYVKIVVDGGPTWYGIVVDQVNERSGESLKNGNPILTGTQQFLCRGLEYLLHRKTLDKSTVQKHAPAAGELEIERAIGFNLGAGLPSSGERQGNMSVALGARGTFVFANSLDTANEWSAAQIVRYLLTYHLPTDKNGIDSLGWNFSNVNVNGILASHKPVLHVHGKTLFQVLNELIDRRRLMAWQVVVDPANERPQIRLFTFAPNPIALPDASTIPANVNQVANWDFDRSNLVQRALVASDDALRFDRVTARGEPQGACFTVEGAGGGGNALLETDWHADLKTEYDAGDGAAAGDGTEIANAHQTARAKDKLKKVYRYFRITPDFDGYIGLNAVWPVNGWFGAAFALTRYSWWPGLRLQEKLPLRLEHDYENPVAVTDALKADSKWEYQRPFVFAQPSGERAFFLDRPGRGEALDSNANSSGRHWACALRMQDDAFGIIVDVHGGPQHLIAKNAFVAADAEDEARYPPEVDYTYLAATVFAEGDGHVERRYPPNVIANPDWLKELILHVPNARLDYLVPGTVIDIGEDGVPITTQGGFVRDDTAYLANVARSAFEWYSTPRHSVQVTLRDLAETRVRGELILVLGGNDNAETINSVVTKCSYNLRAGTATYLTQFAELDLA